MAVALAVPEKKFDLAEVYQPTERQKIFHSCPADFVLYGGAAGGGKSEALLWEAFVQCLETPGNRVLLLRRTFPELNRSLIQRSLAKFPQSVGRYVAGEKSWYFRNGSVMEFGFCERENDVYLYQSAEYGLICFDELTHFTYTQWDYLVNSRLRSVVPGAWPRVRAASNPGNVGHAWVKNLFIDGKKPDVVWEDNLGVKHAFIPARVADNPHLLQNDPQYVARLQKLDEKWRRALLDGDWDIFEGQYFTEWRREIHVCKPFNIPEWWKRFRSLDYGLDCTACYWWAVAQDGRCYLYRELYESGMNLSQAAKRILELTPPGENISYTVASPDLWNRRQDTGIAGYEVMAKAGLHGLVRADDRRVPGWRALREYLQPYQDEQGQTVAKLVVFETCTNLIRTLPILVHDPNDPEDVDDHCEDHGPESVRYGVMSRPPSRSLTPEELHKRRRARRRLIRPVVSDITGW